MFQRQNNEWTSENLKKASKFIVDKDFPLA